MFRTIRLAIKNVVKPAASSKTPANDGPRRHPVTQLFDLLGRRKALRIVWNLRNERSLKFRELARLCEASPSVLNTRLRELRDAGLIDHAPGDGYVLTPHGAELLNHLVPLTRWATAWSKSLD